MSDLIYYPDPILNKISEEVQPQDIQTKEIYDIVVNMMQVLMHSNGIAIAAPQIGINKRIIIISRNKLIKQYQVLFNPIIKAKRSNIWSRNEGCLSIPKIRVDIKRSKYISGEAYDENGILIKLKEQKTSAIVLQHEIDHLNGITMIDRLKPEKYKLEVLENYYEQNNINNRG